MRKLFGTYANTLPNRDGTVFTVGALAGALASKWRIGTPMFVSHDVHRPFGWSQLLGLYLQPNCASLLGASFVPESDAEEEDIQQATFAYVSTDMRAISTEDQSQLKKLLGGNLTDEAIFVRRECSAVVQEGIVHKVFPQFSADDRDKRSLFPLRELEEVGPGVYKIGPLAVFAHRFFRRSLSQLNNLNVPFLEALREASGNSLLDVKIAIDPDSIGLAETYLQAIELQYWWGPKFDDDLNSIPRGVAVHGASERLRYFHSVLKTEFLWHKQGGNATLECEEVLERPSLGIDREHYGFRYVHSIVADGSTDPCHLDGAIRIYDEERFLKRLDHDIAGAGRNTDYVKLWRVDGPIEIGQWKRLIVHFYRDNYLPLEYFQGQEIEVGETARVAVSEEGLAELSDFLPQRYGADDGVEALVSWKERPSGDEGKAVSVVLLQDVAHGDSRSPYVELSALDLIKRLRCEGLQVALPSEAVVCAFEDMDIGFPLFSFNGAGAVEAADRFLGILKDHLARIGGDRAVALTMRVQYGDCDLQLSMIGKLAPLVGFLDCVPAFPSDARGTSDWCQALRSAMDELSPAAQLGAWPRSAVREGMRFQINRVLVPPSTVTRDGEGRLAFKATHEQASVIVGNGIALAPCGLVKKCGCGNCGSNYLACNCMALESADFSVEVEEFNLLGFVWTERPA